jgi:leucyl aminopeptidase
MTDAKDFLLSAKAGSIPIRVVAKGEALPGYAQSWAQAHGFDGTPLSLLPVPDKNSLLREVFVGEPRDSDDAFALGAIASRLPEGTYHFIRTLKNAELVTLGWLTELYKYDPFRETRVRQVRLVVPEGVERMRMVRLANAVALVRDMVNAPANIFGPDELEKEARTIARTHGAKLKVVSGAKLAKEFPLIHTVGMASTRAPRLIDFSWGNPRHPKVTLVGKGVVFDTGGLDIKPSASMLLMKKDMGGAANVLGLASLVMAAKLKLRLRVLVPAVENSIAGNAFRPGDVFKTRKGLTVEIGNTDAEGRLILCDALALADEEKPELIVDMATLTGAARVALGPDLPAFFTDDDALADELAREGLKVNDPIWRLPLWRAYTSMIDTPIADLNNSGGAFAGAITAALFLRRFVEQAKAHVHFDIMAWTPAAKPGRPKGGEAQAMRAVFALLEGKYGS